MKVLQDEWELRFAAVGALWLTNRASRWVHEKRSIIGLPIVVAGCAKAQGASQNQDGWRKRPPMMLRINERRVERRKVGSPLIELSLERAQGSENAESIQQYERGHHLRPPRVPPQRVSQTRSRHHCRRSRHPVTSKGVL